MKVKTGAMLDDPNAIFMVSIADREEKGSDVNVATHLLTDVFEQKIDAAVVISNDSDLALPIKQARARVPVGTVLAGTIVLQTGDDNIVWRLRFDGDRWVSYGTLARHTVQTEPDQR